MFNVGTYFCTRRPSVFSSLYIFILLNLFLVSPQNISCLVGWGCRIHQRHFCRGVWPPPNECPGYDTKQSGGDVPVMLLELWGMQSTPSLSSLPGPPWPGVVAPDRALSMGQIELKYVLMLNGTAWNRTVFTWKLRTYAKMNCLK